MARVLVAGGSLGGLMAANLLARAGQSVTVLEKVSGAMDGRGAGIVTHGSLVNGLQRCGMPAGCELGVAVSGRIALDGQGRVLDELSLPQTLTSWSRLYRLLREQTPAAVEYRQGVGVEGVEQDERGVRVRTTAGVLVADLLIGADGIRSTVRQQLWPRVSPEYAGYVAWRGLCDEAVLSRGTRDLIFERFGFCLPAGEMALGYPVPGAGHRTEPGQRAWNFVWYRGASAPQRLARLLTDADGVHHPHGIAPDKVSWRAIADMRADARRLLAPAFAELIEKCASPFLQPINDLSSDAIAQGRVALLGDAAFVARPHTGMGVTKAMQDAVALADAVLDHGATSQALRAYAAARAPVGQRMVQRGRDLGAYMQACASADHDIQGHDVRAVITQTAIDLKF
jgi:2-polyprenyl-6-methoxyphenol hydroxylase-like FAD-dependent oxidoreductase